MLARAAVMPETKKRTHVAELDINTGHDLTLLHPLETGQ